MHSQGPLNQRFTEFTQDDFNQLNNSELYRSADSSADRNVLQHKLELTISGFCENKSLATNTELLALRERLSPASSGMWKMWEGAKQVFSNVFRSSSPSSQEELGEIDDNAAEQAAHEWIASISSWVENISSSLLDDISKMSFKDFQMGPNFVFTLPKERLTPQELILLHQALDDKITEKLARETRWTVRAKCNSSDTDGIKLICDHDRDRYGDGLKSSINITIVPKKRKDVLAESRYERNKDAAKVEEVINKVGLLRRGGRDAIYSNCPEVVRLLSELDLTRIPKEGLERMYKALNDSALDSLLYNIDVEDNTSFRANITRCAIQVHNAIKEQDRSERK